MIKLKDILQEQSDVVGTGLSNIEKVKNSKITDLFIGQGEKSYEKVAAKLLSTLKAIDINVTPNMKTADVSNEIKKLAVKGLLVPGQLNSVTISSHGTGCNQFNYNISRYGGTGTFGQDIVDFWNLIAKFCNSNTKIFLGGCSVASEPKTVARIAKVTNCTVTAPTGTYYPVTGAVSKTKNKFNLPQRLGKYLTCTNKPEGDEGIYNKFIVAHFSDLFDDNTLSIGRMMSIIKDFRDDLNYISAQAYEKLNQNQTNEKLISTIMEQFTIRLIKDYIKSLGCYTSKENPIQGTRQAIFK
jgi:hypothetical protein